MKNLSVCSLVLLLVLLMLMPESSTRIGISLGSTASGAEIGDDLGGDLDDLDAALESADTELRERDSEMPADSPFPTASGEVFLIGGLYVQNLQGRQGVVVKSVGTGPCLRNEGIIVGFKPGDILLSVGDEAVRDTGHLREIVKRKAAVGKGVYGGMDEKKLPKLNIVDEAKKGDFVWVGFVTVLRQNRERHLMWFVKKE